MHFAERLYPQSRLSALLSGSSPNKPELDLSIGEPNVALDEKVLSTIPAGYSDLALYPRASLQYELQTTISCWLQSRYGSSRDFSISPEQIAILAGSREGIFMLPIALFNRQLQQGEQVTIAMPDPGYPIYLASAENIGARVKSITHKQLHQLTADASDTFTDWSQIDLMFVCSPNNPTGEVLSLKQWIRLIELAKEHQFTLVADECYSEIYIEPYAPTGILEACVAMGNIHFDNCLAVHSLSKRSGLPGLRSGFMAGDQTLIKKLQAYRNYHGVSLSSIQLSASQAAWSDEEHVCKNRQTYSKKFTALTQYLEALPSYQVPQGGFYLWLDTGCPSEQICGHLYQHFGIKALPGHYLAISADAVNDYQNYIRIALVCSQEDIEFVGNAIKESILSCSRSNAAGDHVA
ncbi:aminotransferase class I/II-fold pyridoxal phosphate-dependent enzyme [Pseudoalteromonas sp. McH1-7]|uniref:aminotransferase class I/II-fold pyridoxal phosphate-dependent enzyme n=1 Tax=Pseudoalteromonas sp. McH1-7 TaxID=2745574 RepID=UPI001590217B|nr:aminotransferase class I/II-fold pyridoxal phosphate-dependent enzyme [Pseudoalteromonas sp. McH1-7]NUZ09448.1 aminotransferase class I/II-fold pyridoxal phosphate-dependent enzyme [Pseudoalteromonas sp. McH1-7]